MSSLFFEEILQEFCRRNHLRGEVFDEDGFCHLVVDGDTPLLLRADEANTRLSIYGIVPSRISGKISRSLIPMIKQQVLAVNVTMRNNGPDLIPQAPWILGYLHLPVANLHVEDLEEGLEKFISWLARYR